MNYVQLYQAIQDYSENTEPLFVANIPRFVQEAEQRVYNSVQIPALRKNVTGNFSSGNQYLSLPNDYLSTYSVAVIDSSNNYNYLLNKDVNFMREAYPSVTYSGTAYQGTPGDVPKYYALFGPQYGNANELSLIVAPTPDQSYPVELHYFYYPVSIVQGVIATFGNPTGGTLYTNGNYQNVSLTGGNGVGAVATITVSGGAVTSVVLDNGGSFYLVGDVLSASSSDIGGSGSGFLISVTGVSNANGTSWLGDNYDPVLFYGAMREALIFMKGEQDMMQYYETKYAESLVEFTRLCNALERGDAYREGQLKVPFNTV
jgi:hypothetical protein